MYVHTYIHTHIYIHTYIIYTYRSKSGTYCCVPRATMVTPTHQKVTFTYIVFLVIVIGIDGAVNSTQVFSVAMEMLTGGFLCTLIELKICPV
jgi:hypothetical protein